MLGGALGVGIAGLDALSRPALANALHVGRPAPPATFVALDGERITTQALIGRVVILTFWATWCGPCRTELPLLSAYATRHAAEGLTVLGFSLDSPEDIDKVKRAAQNFSFPVGFVANSELPGFGRIWRIPVNFTIDRSGLLVDDGWKDREAAWTEERLERIVTPLLHGSS
jgi:thiol-disulfide isomerase/thioredoxin